MTSTTTGHTRTAICWPWQPYGNRGKPCQGQGLNLETPGWQAKVQAIAPHMCVCEEVFFVFIYLKVPNGVNSTRFGIFSRFQRPFR